MKTGEEGERRGKEHLSHGSEVASARGEKGLKDTCIGKGREEGYSKGRLVRTSVIPWMLEVE